MTDLNTFNQIVSSKYFIWNHGLGFIPRKSLMENKDNWSFFRHKFILCMSEYLFNPKTQVNDPSIEFRLAKKLFVEIFGEEIDCTNKNTNNVINTYLKMAFLLYRGEINWLEDKQRISIGVNKANINKLFTEKIDPENSLRNIYDSRMRPERYEKSVTQMKKEHDNLKISKEIMKYQLTNPILFDRLYKQITEFQFKQINENIELEKEIMGNEKLELYLSEIYSGTNFDGFVPLDKEEIFEVDDDGNIKDQKNYGEPDYDPKYFHQIYGISNPVIHNEQSLKEMDYTHSQIDLKLFPYCFPRPSEFYSLEKHQEIAQLFYSLRQTLNGQIKYENGVPRTQLRASFNYTHHKNKFLDYMEELERIFPNYHYIGSGSGSMKKANNDDDCWGTIEGKFYRIPIFENESYDPDYWEMETTDKPIEADKL